MKFTLSWLKTHLDTDAPLADDHRHADPHRAGTGRRRGSHRRASLTFRIAHVVEAVQHPNADRLRVCTVDTGDGIVSVVCGAPNARTGMKGVFAAPGSFIPGHQRHAARRRNPRRAERRHAAVRARDGAGRGSFRHRRSAGRMRRSACRMCAGPGSDDPVIEINVTPNRGDCFQRARRCARSGGRRDRHAEAVAAGGASSRASTAARAGRSICRRRARGFSAAPSAA